MLKLENQEIQKLATAICSRMECANMSAHTGRYQNELCGILKSLDLLEIQYTILYDGWKYTGIRIQSIEFSLENYRSMAALVSVLEIKLTLTDMEYLRENWKAFYNDPDKWSNCADLVKRDLEDYRNTNGILEEV